LFFLGLFLFYDKVLNISKLRPIVMSIKILEELVEGSNLRILIDTSAIDFYDIVPDFREIAGAKSFYDMSQIKLLLSQKLGMNGKDS